MILVHEVHRLKDRGLIRNTIGVGGVGVGVGVEGGGAQFVINLQRCHFIRKFIRAVYKLVITTSAFIHKQSYSSSLFVVFEKFAAKVYRHFGFPSRKFAFTESWDRLLCIWI